MFLIDSQSRCFESEDWLVCRRRGVMADECSHDLGSKTRSRRRRCHDVKSWFFESQMLKLLPFYRSEVVASKEDLEREGGGEKKKKRRKEEA